MMTKCAFLSVFGSMAFMGLAVSPLSAAIVATDSGFQLPGDLPVPSSSDLLQTNLQSATSSGGSSWGSSVPMLYDGTLGTVSEGTFVEDTTGWVYNGDSTLTFNLNDAFNINSISVWTGAYQSVDRLNQHWVLYTSTDGGTNWSAPLYTEISGAATSAQWLGYGMSLQLSDSSGTLASNVNALKFDVSRQIGNTYDADMYREIDVVGTPVPEPATLSLLGLGALLSLSRRRRL